MAKIKLDIIVAFTTQFSSMTKAHIPLLKSIDNLQKDIMDKNFKNILAKIKEDVKKGIDFSETLEKFPNVFDKIYVNMVKAGMESGKLAVTLNQLNIYLIKAAQTANQIRTALSYPKFMAVAMVVVASGMLTFVIPMFEKMFKKAEKDLPTVTQVAITASKFLRNHYIEMIVFFIGFYFGLKYYLSTKHGKKVVDNIKLKLPILGELNKKTAISKFIRTFGVLVQSDVVILKAIELSKSSAGNIVIENKIDEVVEKIKKGYEIAEAFKEVEIFPDIIIQMIHSGEEGGNLYELLISSSDYYDDQVDSELKSIVSLINPIMTVIMGLFVAALMAAIFLPIFDMGNNIR